MSKKTPSRHRWFPFVTNIGDTFYLHIGYKTSRGDISELKSSKRNASVKIPFGSPVKCEFYSVQEENLQHGEFLFTNNNNDTIKLRLANIDCFLIEKLFPDVSNSFAKKVASMIVEKKESILSRFFALLTHSRGFERHREEVHTDEGEEIEDTIEYSLFSNKCILKDFQEFYNAAVDSAKVLSRPANDIRTFLETKRKKGESNTDRKRKHYMEVVDDREKKELIDDDGLEKKYYDSLFGLANVPLANLKIHPGLLKQLSQARVDSIVASMEKRFDPSLNVPVICPASGQVVSDLNDVSTIDFLVITKIHTVKAFMELDSKGRFISMVSHEDGSIPCFVANLDIDELVHYGNFRNNDIASEFSKHSAPQDLLRSYVSLYHKSGTSCALSFIDRMSCLARFSPDVATALRKMCMWSISGVSALVDTIVKYEKFETSDKKPNNYRVNLSRQERLLMPDRLFKRLGKVSESFFMTVYLKVTSGSLSLLSCIEEYEKNTKMEKVCAVLSAVAEFRTYENIKADHPEEFEYEQLKHFFGAEIRKNGTKNGEALRLEEYYHSVTCGSSDLNNIQYVPTSDIKSAVMKGDLDNFEVLIVRLKNEIECADVCNLLLGRKITAQLIMILFPSWKCKLEFLDWMKINVSSEIKVNPIFFQCESNDVVQPGVFKENLIYALLVGEVYSTSRFKVFNGSLDELPVLVSQLAGLESSVAVLVGLDEPLFKVHSESGRGKVSYFASQKAISEFRIISIAPSEEGNTVVQADEIPDAQSITADFNRISGATVTFPTDSINDSAIGLDNESSTSPFKYGGSQIMNSDRMANANSCTKKL